jgi:hypothetical protein
MTITQARRCLLDHKSRVMRAARSLAIVCAFSLSACGGDDGCVNNVQSRAVSSDGKHQAVVFQRGCGATTAPSTQVSITPVGDSIPSGVGNVVVTKDALPASVSWEGTSHVVVQLDRSSRTIARNTEVDGVTVEYR